MSLRPGQRLGSYEVISALGAGGMGEVYRARDAKLNREVALKVLPELFARDPDRLGRFRREAQVLAALNHPNIGHIYGFEDSGATHALVLELVEGPTLADRLALGPIPLADALPIARQIADALEAAHDQGIIHRDLKPANVKVQEDGTVKVLDFGLAKALDPASASGADALNSPTLTARATQMGTILGTAAYMSPEQAKGRAVDRRADIWAFGAVLYEMLAGRRAFKGEDISDTLASVLKDEVAWEALPADLPASVRRLLRRSLEKDPKRRLSAIGDARLELDEAASGAGDALPVAPTAATSPDTRRSSRASRLGARGAALAILALLLIVAGAAWMYRRFAEPAATVSSGEFALVTDFADSASAPSLSPDGRMVTFIRGGPWFLSSGQIYVKLLPNGDAKQLTHDPRLKYAPVFTPDGSRVAYTMVDGSGWNTWTVPVLGGEPTQLLPNASGLTWIDDRRVLFSEIEDGALLHMGIVTATQDRGGERTLYFPGHARAMAHFSHVSPDRKWILAVEMDQTGDWLPCRLLPFDGGTQGRPVGPAGACISAGWSPDGAWMFFSASVHGESHLWRQRFPDGVPMQVTSGAATEEEGVAMAPDGRSLVTSVGRSQRSLWLHDLHGERLLPLEGLPSDPQVSFDGTRVFCLVRQTTEPSARGLTSVDLASGKTDRMLTEFAILDFDLSHDGRQVAFTAMSPEHQQQIWIAAFDRRSPPRRIAQAADQVKFGAEQELVFRSLEGTSNFVDRINQDGGGRARVLDRPVIDLVGVTPGGAWAVVILSLTGKGSGVVVPVHGSGAARPLCNTGCVPRWSPNGRYLYLSAVGERTFVLPLAPHRDFPEFPAGDGPALASWMALPDAHYLETGLHPAPGLDPSVYVFLKVDERRNLFRVPVR